MDIPSNSGGNPDRPPTFFLLRPPFLFSFCQPSLLLINLPPLAVVDSIGSPVGLVLGFFPSLRLLNTANHCDHPLYLFPVLVHPPSLLLSAFFLFSSNAATSTTSYHDDRYSYTYRCSLVSLIMMSPPFP